MTEAKPHKLHRFIHGFKGYLVKQGKVFKQWRPRYFVLDKRKLRYYADDTLSSFLGDLIIDDTLQLYDVAEEVEGMKCLFYLIGKNSNGNDEVMFLSATNDRDKQDWIEAISDSAHDGFKQIFQPDLWSSAFYPTVDISISYVQSGVSVDNGNILRPACIEFPPEVVLKGVGPDEKYSFIMLDTDPISDGENNSKNKNDNFYLHWGVINFNGSDIKTGDVLAPYIAPAPVYNSGLHRYFFLLFKQRTSISPIVLNEIVEMFLNRDGFAFRKWVKLMNFGDPAAVNGFYAGWEEYCDELHAKAGYLPPEMFRSPNQENNIAKEAERQRVEKAKLDLYRDLNLKDVFYGDVEKISLPNVHSMAIKITYNNNEIARDGVILNAKLTKNEPVVTYDIDPKEEETFYTLIMTDPDAPSRVNPTLREFVHWVVVNIPGNKVASGDEVLSYACPAPPYASGLHRYVFCLYRQKSKLAPSYVREAKEYYKDRKEIKTFMWLNTLSTFYITAPIGLEAFCTEWDACVDDIHAAMGFLPPNPYRSPKQILASLGDNNTSMLNDLDSNKEDHNKEVMRKRKEAIEKEQQVKAQEAEGKFKHSLILPDVSTSEIDDQSEPSPSRSNRSPDEGDLNAPISSSIEKSGSPSEQTGVKGAPGMRKVPTSLAAETKLGVAADLKSLQELSNSDRTEVLEAIVNAPQVVQVTEKETISEAEARTRQVNLVESHGVSGADLQQLIEDHKVLKQQQLEQQNLIMQQQMMLAQQHQILQQQQMIQDQDLRLRTRSNDGILKRSTSVDSESTHHSSPSIKLQKKISFREDRNETPKSPVSDESDSESSKQSDKASSTEAPKRNRNSSSVSSVTSGSAKKSLQRNPSISNMSTSDRPASMRKASSVIITHDDLDQLLSTNFSNVHGFVDDEDNVSVNSKVSSLTAGTKQNPSSPPNPTPAATMEFHEVRNTPSNPIQRKSLFKSQSQYINTAGLFNFGGASAASTTGSAMPPPPPFSSSTTPDSLGTPRKGLARSASLYFKPSADKNPEDIKASLQEAKYAVEKCKIFDINTPSVFEGGKRKFVEIIV